AHLLPQAQGPRGTRAGIRGRARIQPEHARAAGADGGGSEGGEEMLDLVLGEPVVRGLLRGEAEAEAEEKAHGSAHRVAGTRPCPKAWRQPCRRSSARVRTTGSPITAK